MGKRFNPGDRVIFKINTLKSNVTVDKSYIVLRNYIDNTIVIIDDNGSEACIYSHRFVLDIQANREVIINEILN